MSGGYHISPRSHLSHSFTIHSLSEAYQKQVYFCLKPSSCPSFQYLRSYSLIPKPGHIHITAVEFRRETPSIITLKCIARIRVYNFPEGSWERQNAAAFGFGGEIRTKRDDAKLYKVTARLRFYLSSAAPGQSPNGSSNTLKRFLRKSIR